MNGSSGVGCRPSVCLLCFCSMPRVKRIKKKKERMNPFTINPLQRGEAALSLRTRHIFIKMLILWSVRCRWSSFFFFPPSDLLSFLIVHNQPPNRMHILSTTHHLPACVTAYGRGSAFPETPTRGRRQLTTSRCHCGEKTKRKNKATEAKTKFLFLKNVLKMAFSISGGGGSSLAC